METESGKYLLNFYQRYSLNVYRNIKSYRVAIYTRQLRISDLEVNALKAINADASLREFMGPRADSSDMKAELYNQISNYGYAELDSMTSDLANKRTLNTVSQYLIGAGLDNDLLVDEQRLINQLDL